jgi:hypothetical protein
MDQDLVNKRGVPGPRQILRQKLLDRKRCTCVRCAMVQDPRVGEQFRPYTMNPLPQMFKILDVILLVDSLSWWNKLSKHYLFTFKETNKHCLSYDCDIHTLLWQGELACYAASLQDYIENPQLSSPVVTQISCFVILLDLLQRINESFLPPLLLVLSEVLGHHICTNFLVPKFSIKINRKTSIIRHQRCYLFDVFIRF